MNVSMFNEVRHKVWTEVTPAIGAVALRASKKCGWFYKSNNELIGPDATNLVSVNLGDALPLKTIKRPFLFLLTSLHNFASKISEVSEIFIRCV